MLSTHARIVADHGDSRNLRFGLTSQKQHYDIECLQAALVRPLVSVPHFKDDNSTAEFVPVRQDRKVFGCVPDHGFDMFGRTCEPERNLFVMRQLLLCCSWEISIFGPS